MKPPLTYTVRDFSLLTNLPFKPATGVFMRHLRNVLFFLLAGLLAVTSSCKGKSAREKNGPLRIGFSMDSLLLERWQRDRDLFVQRAKELGAEVLVQSAAGNDSVRVRHAENLL